jgi:hypothetical protein
MVGTALECAFSNTLGQGLFSFNSSEFFIFGGAMVSMIALGYVILNPATKDKQNVINEHGGNLIVEKKQVYLNKVLKLIRKFYHKIIN